MKDLYAAMFLSWLAEGCDYEDCIAALRNLGLNRAEITEVESYAEQPKND